MSVSLICLGGLEAEDVGGGRSWVGGVVLVSDRRRLRSDHSEAESK